MAGLGTRDSGLGLRCDTMMPIVKAIDFPRFEDDVGDFRRLMNCEIFSGTAVISLAVGSLDLWGTLNFKSAGLAAELGYGSPALVGCLVIDEFEQEAITEQIRTVIATCDGATESDVIQLLGEHFGIEDTDGHLLSWGPGGG